jgi:hypothetical protein
MRFFGKMLKIIEKSEKADKTFFGKSLSVNYSTFNIG